MRLSFRCLGLFALGLALVAPACSPSDEASTDAVIGVPGPNATIAFEQVGTVTLAPGQLTKLSVKTSPPDAYEVAFFLVGSALDASLGATKVVASPDGRAEVELKAPNGATTFAVRAKIKDGPSAELHVSVSDEGFAALNVLPAYDGARETREWVASVVTGTTCDALSSTFPDDPPGALSIIADDGDPLIVEDVPVGPSLAVFVRGGHYMWGCTDVANLPAGDMRDVAVPIVAKPLDLSGTLLDVDLAFTPEPQAWASLLDHARTVAFDALVDPLAGDASTLLATMASLAVEPAQFASAAQQYGWYGTVSSQLAGVDLRDFAWQLSAQGLASEPPLVTGRIADVGSEGLALFTMQSLGTITPDECGVPAEYLVSWTADSLDQVSMGGTLFWLPSRLVTVAAERAAADAVPGQTMPEALAQEVDCDALGAALAGFPTCDGACLAALCREALAVRWQLARDASASALQIGVLPLQLLALAEFDDEAAITAFAGTWVGQLSDGDVTADVTGDALGSGVVDPPP